MSGKKSRDDVDQLLKDLSIGGLNYREFSAPQAAKLKLADKAAQAPVANLPKDAPAARTEPAVLLPETSLSPKPAPQATAPQAGLPPSAAPIAPAVTVTPGVARSVHESPLNFTFERLRRQVIAARATGPLLDLPLPPRQRVVPAPRLERLQQRALADVFAALVQAPAAKRHIS